MDISVQDFEQQIWPFYYRLENEFVNILTYVEFSNDNYSTYSVEFEKQLLSICSEIDVLFKLLCQKIDSSKSPKKIHEYFEILKDYRNIIDTKVKFKNFEEEFIPFESWNENSSPSWWSAYNKIKHKRMDDENYKKGNLENVFMSLAALYILNRFLYKEVKPCRLDIEPIPASLIFNIVGWERCAPQGNGFYLVARNNGDLSMDFA